MNDYKRITSYWLLIVCIGIIFYTSFGTFSFGDFDWKYFIVVIIYIIVSELLMYVVNYVFVNSNNKVVEAKKIKHKCYEIIDNNNSWDKISLISLYESVIEACMDAYHIFYYSNNKISNPSDIEKMDQLFLDFRSRFLNKKINNRFLKDHNVRFLKRRKILKLQKKQDDDCYWDKEYIKYKSGRVLPRSINSYLFNVISILVSVVPTIVTIIITLNIAPTETFLFRLSLIGVYFIADIVTTFMGIKADIKYEIKEIPFYNRIINDYIYSSEYSFFKNSSYYAFYKYSVPNDKEKRALNMYGLLDRYRDEFYSRHSYIVDKVDY